MLRFTPTPIHVFGDLGKYFLFFFLGKYFLDDQLLEESQRSPIYSSESRANLPSLKFVSLCRPTSDAADRKLRPRASQLFCGVSGGTTSQGISPKKRQVKTPLSWFCFPLNAKEKHVHCRNFRK